MPYPGSWLSMSQISIFMAQSGPMSMSLVARSTIEFTISGRPKNKQLPDPKTDQFYISSTCSPQDLTEFRRCPEYSGVSLSLSDSFLAPLSLSLRSFGSSFLQRNDFFFFAFFPRFSFWDELSWEANHMEPRVQLWRRLPRGEVYFSLYRWIGRPFSSNGNKQYLLFHSVMRGPHRWHTVLNIFIFFPKYQHSKIW